MLGGLPVALKLCKSTEASALWCLMNSAVIRGGRQLIDGLARKESWPAGRPNIRRLFQRGYFQEFVLHRELSDLVVPL